MKKALSILLAVVLVLGCLPLGFVSAENTYGDNLIAGFTSDFTNTSPDTAEPITSNFGDAWQQNATSTTAHGGGGWKIPQWNGWKSGSIYEKYVKIEVTGLKTNTTYLYEMSYGSNYATDVTSVYVKGDESNTLILSDRTRTTITNPVAAGGCSTWVDLALTFTTNSTDTDYVIQFQPINTGSNAGGDQYVFSDLSLREVLVPLYNVSASVQGGGLATVSKLSAYEGESVTFTATPARAEEFQGWYVGEELVSTANPYTATVGAANLALTAKFTSNNLIANHVKNNGYTLVGNWTGCDFADGTGSTVSGGKTWIFQYGGYGMYIGSGSFQGTENLNDGLLIEVDNLKANTKYNLIYANGYDWYLDLVKVAVWDEATQAYVAAGEITGGTNTASSGYYTAADYTFVTGDAGKYALYISIKGGKGSAHRAISGRDAWDGVTFSDAALTEVAATVSATAEGNGTATASASVASSGQNVTFTAVPNHYETFNGWYNGSQKVSANLVYTTVVTEDLALVAKFSDITTSEKNLVKDFTRNNGINYTYTDWCNDLSGANTRYGGYGLKFGNGNLNSENGVIFNVTGLKPYTVYKFGFSHNGDHYMLLDSVTSVTGVASVITESVNPKNTGWIGVDSTFVTGSETAYAIKVAALNHSKNDSHRPEDGDWSEVIVSDFVLVEYKEMTDNTVVTAGFTSSTANDETRTGVSMRKAEGETLQALRFKNTIDADTLAKKELAENGYTLVEYGSITMRTEYLDGAELVLTDTINSHAVLKGVAFDANTDIRFADNADGSITFTAALYNIGKSSGSDDIDYNVWGKSYTLRAYALFRNAAGAEVVVYGEEASACVFDIMAAIQAGDNQADKDYVATLLENADIADAYRVYTEQ